MYGSGNATIGGESEWAVAVLGDVSADTATALCSRVVDLLRDTAADVVICDVGAVRDPVIGTVDTLLRLQLTAGRHGGRIVLGHSGGALRALISQMGVADLLPELPDGDLLRAT